MRRPQIATRTDAVFPHTTCFRSIYGFMGCCHIGLARTLFGKLRPDRGRIAVDGRDIRLRSTAAARRAGIAFVPESRRAMLFHHEPVYKNVSISILDRIARWLLKPEAERRIARRHVDALRIRTPSVDVNLGALRSEEHTSDLQSLMRTSYAVFC